MHLVPGHRALAATGQTNRPGAQVGATPGLFRQMLQGHIPARVGRPLLVEVQIEEHQRLDHQPRVDQHVGHAHLLIGKLRQVDHTIEQGFKLG